MQNFSHISLGHFFNNIFPFKVQKISIHIGSQCPNRNGEKGRNGCTYCNNRAFSPRYIFDNITVSQQLKKGISFFSYKYPNMKYIAYFQTYTNTHSCSKQHMEQLLTKYYEAMNYPNVVGLIIGTRPDCISDKVLSEIKKITQDNFLLIEYGVESTNNDSLKLINRGHTYEEALEAIYRTNKQSIFCGIHLILGLPGESREMILSHAEKVSSLPITTIKLHQLQIIKNTIMAKQFKTHPEHFQLFETIEEYMDLCLDFIKKLPNRFILDRLIAQAPQSLLISPKWKLKNSEFTKQLYKRLSK